MPYAGPDDPGAQGEQPSTKSRCRWRSTRSTQDSAGARVDQCARCKDQRHGWCDQYSTFYCEHCWTQFDTVQGAGGGDYVGKIWHDEILKEDNIAAEDEDDGDGGNLLEYVKKTASLIENDKKHASSCQDAGNDSDGEKFEEDDEVKDLPNDNALSKFAKPSGFELQPAHVVVIVDTSGSMRTEDVKPENGLDCITRIAAVTCSLATFFQKHVQSSSPHKFSLISFNEGSWVHFTTKKAKQAMQIFSRAKGCQFTASYGTHFVEGLTAAENLLGRASETPHLLIFSDGRPADGKQMVQFAQQMLHEWPTLRIHAIGFGDGLGFEFLQQLTSLGRGTFAPSSRSVTALHSAFASVTSSITASQTVTASSRKSSAYSFQGRQQPSSGEDALNDSKTKCATLRDVTFETPNQFVWSTSRSLSFQVRRRWFRFKGENFKMFETSSDYKHNPVSMRLQPFTHGGMRLVYCFKDSTIPLFVEQSLHESMRDSDADAKMVAKVSKYSDGWHNSSDIVSAYAKSSAVARFYAHVFNLFVMDTLRWEGRQIARIIFLECYVYKTEGEATAPAPFFVGERFLPGVFRKYNSNHGFVDLEVPDSEVAQAFSHFTFQASQGEHMVLDLQGVHLDNQQRRRPHLFLTDPQVVSVERSFGPGDLGNEGMRAFFASHRCGTTCKMLGLNRHAWKKGNAKGRKETSSSSTSAGMTMVPVTWSTATASNNSGYSGSISDLRLAEPPPSPDIKALALTSAETSTTAGKLTAAPNKQPQGNSFRAWPEPAVEAGFMNRYAPSFGAKTEGPLSALMARSGAEGGRPDYDMLLQRRVSTEIIQPLPSPNLQKDPAASSVSDTAQEQDGRQKSEKCSVDTSGSVETTSQCSPPSPNDSQASTASSRLATSSQKTVAESQHNPTPQEVKKSVVYGPGGKKIILSASCRGHVIAAIAKEFSIPEDEQHLLQESSPQPNVDFYRVEHKMDPRKLRFTQSSINPAFRDGRPIYDLLNDLNSHNIDPLRELEPLDVVWHDGFWRSLSNRRLWALKHCTMAFSDQPLFVRVRVRQPDAEFRTKGTSTNDGVSVLIMQRSRSPSPCAAKVAAAV